MLWGVDGVVLGVVCHNFVDLSFFLFFGCGLYMELVFTCVS